MLRYIPNFCVLITIILTVYAQLAVKWGVTSKNHLAAQPYQFYLELLTNPWIISAFFAAFLASLMWMTAMSKLPLNITYPLMSLTFPLVMLFSSFLFSESISVHQTLSVVLIMAGVILLGF